MSFCADCGIALAHQTRGRPLKFCPLHRKRPYKSSVDVNERQKAKRTRMELAKRAAPILSAAGWTLNDIARLAGYTNSAALSYLGVTAAERDSSLRSVRMIEMYRSGMTLGEIGQEYNITRERVRQLISKLGISRAEGGIAAKGRSSQIAYQNGVTQRRDDDARKNFGCDYETVKRLNNGEPIWKAKTRAICFVRQRLSAATRDIGWELIFQEWCAIWDESGKWAQRGRGRGHYCMSRRRDAGAYAVGNVQIVTNEQNIAEGWDVTPYYSRVKPNEELKAIQRRVYDLRLSGKGHAEIGAELGISAKTSLQYCVTGKKLAQRDSLVAA